MLSSIVEFSSVQQTLAMARRYKSLQIGGENEYVFIVPQVRAWCAGFCEFVRALEFDTDTHRH